MLSLHTNAAAMSSEQTLGNTQSALNTALTDLGTGYRVNSAMDDAAGLQIAVRLQANINGMTVAQNNTQNGISLMQTAEGSLNELTNVLLRMKDLATQAADASTSSSDKLALQEEFNALAQQTGSIFTNSSYAGQQLFATGTSAGTPAVGGLLASSGSGLVFQVGASSAETMTVNTTQAVTDLFNALSGASSDNFLTSAGAAGVSSNPTVIDTTTTSQADSTQGTAATTGIQIMTGTGANSEIDLLNTAIDAVGSLRGQLGAYSNDLQHVYNNLGNMVTNETTSRGRILDVDYATETSTATSLQLQMQAGTAALKQASNSMSQMVQTLLQ